MGSLNESRQYSCNILDVLEQWVTFYIITLSLNVVLPLLITAVLYIVVCYKLCSREVPGEGASRNERQADAIKTARKVTSMMITIVVLYVLCFFPFFIGNTLYFFGNVEVSPEIFFVSLFLVAFAYSGLNPYVYLIFNQKFRNGFKTWFRNCLGNFNIILNILSFRSESYELQHIETA